MASTTASGASASISKGARVLVVEDQAPLARVYVEYLTKAGHHASSVATGADAIEAVRSYLPDLMLLDLHLPDMSGLEVLARIREEQIPTATIVITANGSIGTAVEAMQAGAYDFVVKPFTADRLAATIRNSLERCRLERFVETIRREDSGQFHSFVGSSPAMQAVYRTIGSVAASKATVFITGESGTGKEVCAEALHRASPRRKKPFVAINCAAIPKELIESEIFGHVKGAFTGASADRDGAATQADGGTLFLDELCEMDTSLQTKLLRFLQTNSFQRVGGTKPESVDIRIVCATNRDPFREVADGRFREDLFYRLHVIPIQLPPLRDRDGDVVEIAIKLLRDYAAEEGKAFCDFDAAAEACLRSCLWPGNVRQLQNVIRHIVVLHEGTTVTADMLPATVRNASMHLSSLSTQSRRYFGFTDKQLTGGGSTTVAAVDDEPVMPLWLLERDMIERAIRRCDGNIPRAAALLEVAPSTIYRKRQSWMEAMNRPGFTGGPIS